MALLKKIVGGVALGATLLTASCDDSKTNKVSDAVKHQVSNALTGDESEHNNKNKGFSELGSDFMSNTYVTKGGKVYLYHHEGGELTEIEGADPTTFESLYFGYSKDKNYLYCGVNKLEGLLNISEVNLDGILLNTNYVKDTKTVFYTSQKVEGADAPTFEEIGDGYARDCNHVYKDGEVLQGAKPATFQIELAND